MLRSNFLRPLTSGLLGITLMLPASYFMLTLLARIFFGAKGMYYYIAPSFLQSPYHLFAFHKAQLIVISLILAILFNVLTIVRVDLERGKHGLELGFSIRRYWLNTAVALQALLLLIVLIAYTLIQHVRY
ncbi:hypothetical protein ACQ86N_48135 [Puia sp. P3]|uniref:hypothetical protein n=1 Tax=Puia sp. P3 TaxID=3423952 RepID=UPI003D67E854